MSELRNRVIAILHDSGDMPASKASRLADALIADLGLTLERKEHPHSETTESRWVTAWEYDDE